MAGDVPPAWADKIVHTTLSLPGGGRALGYDAPPGSYEPGCGFSLGTDPPDGEAARAVFDALADGGASPCRSQRRSGRWRSALVDRFGVTWAINCERSPLERRAPSCGEAGKTDSPLEPHAVESALTRAAGARAPGP